MPSRVIISRTVAMEEAEEVLKRAMVATITGTRPAVSADAVADVLHYSFGLMDGDFSVHTHHPEDFLLIFHSKAALDRVAGDHIINGRDFTLSIRPWCKLAHAGSGKFEYLVDLEIRGIPSQSWQLATAEHILGSSCWIERLHPATRSREDLAVFRLSGRCHDPLEIKRATTLEIVEHLPGRTHASPPVIRTLTYPISVRLVSVVLDQEQLVHDGEPDERQEDAADGNIDNAGQRNGRNRPRRRGRKRRRTGAAPDGRADDMAIDSIGWTTSNLGRADGVAVDAGWPTSRGNAVEEAPPAVHDSDRTIQPWPSHGGPQLPRRRPKRAKGRKLKAVEAAKIRQVKAATPTATGPSQPALRPDGLSPTQASALDTSPARANSNSPAQADSAAQHELISTSQELHRDHCASDHSLQSEVPESEPDRSIPSSPAAAPDPVSGQKDASMPGATLSATPDAVHAERGEAATAPIACNIGTQAVSGARPTVEIEATTPPIRILQRSMGREAQGAQDGHATPVSPTPVPASRFATPPITMRRSTNRTSAAASQPKTLTLGDFLAAATKQICPVLPTPGKRPRRQPPNFSPRRGRSATAAKIGAPPTAERRAQVQLLRTLGIIGVNQKITAAEMKAYEDVFALPIPSTVLAAIAALLDYTIPAAIASTPNADLRDGSPIGA
jgi:hypothetical protein